MPMKQLPALNELMGKESTRKVMTRGVVSQTLAKVPEPVLST